MNSSKCVSNQFQLPESQQGVCGKTINVLPYAHLFPLMSFPSDATQITSNEAPQHRALYSTMSLSHLIQDIGTTQQPHIISFSPLLKLLYSYYLNYMVTTVKFPLYNSLPRQDIMQAYVQRERESRIFRIHDQYKFNVLFYFNLELMQ